MNFLLVYIASVSDNLHTVAGTLLFIIGMAIVWGWLASCIDKDFFGSSLLQSIRLNVGKVSSCCSCSLRIWRISSIQYNVH